MPGGLAPGAPGIYYLPDAPIRALTGVRMDVTAFVGVAPRGPARLPTFAADWAPRPCRAGRGTVMAVPVAVESWTAYRQAFGAFEGPGLLPYAVAAFFAQGGRRAWIVRIVHAYGGPEDDGGVAAARVPGIRTSGGAGLVLRARDEGSWGNRLSAVLSFRTRPVALERATLGAAELSLPTDLAVPNGALLRVTPDGGPPVLRFVSDVRREWRSDAGVRRDRLLLDRALLLPAGAAVRLDVVEGELAIDDGDGRLEKHVGLGLSPRHPRWLAAVLVGESALLLPDPGWIDDDLAVDDPRLPALSSGTTFAGGEDRWQDVTPADFFDPEWVPGDECPGRGVHALTELCEVSLVVAPDLYSPRALVPPEPIVDAPTAGPTFEPCVPSGRPPVQGRRIADLDGLRLDPHIPADREQIIGWQQQLVDLAELLGSFVVLLDVPPGLSQAQMLDWRSRFASAYAAGYHPWLRVARPDDDRDALVSVPPSAVAAGIIAQRELLFGVPFGPANVLVEDAVDVDDLVSPARHDELHPAGVNVFLRERDGIRLTAARTLSRDPDFRQLNVRRLITMLRRVLEQQMQWMVFEPNGPALRAEVRHLLRVFLRGLFRAGAFTGAREEEAFFVQCDEELNPPPVVDAGRLVAHVGVAPSEPLEFIVLRIARDAEGQVAVTG